MAQAAGTVHRLDFDGVPAWRKCYGGGRRRIRLALLAAVVAVLGIPALRPPPRHPGGEGRAVEQDRIQALEHAGIHVPRILHSEPDALVLSDLGPTLAARLRAAASGPADRMLRDAALAIARVHAAGQYLGQPLPRNLTLDDRGGIGFLDFEEDPGEVMTLAHAQVRDWLVFVSGVARHVPFDESAIGAALRDAMAGMSGDVRAELRRSVGRLGVVRVIAPWFGRRAAGLGKAVGGLQQAL